MNNQKPPAIESAALDETNSGGIPVTTKALPGGLPYRSSVGARLSKGNKVTMVTGRAPPKIQLTNQKTCRDHRTQLPAGLENRHPVVTNRPLTD